jgi:1,4-dihydroxy-2-naphthoyl-CoA synthase
MTDTSSVHFRVSTKTGQLQIGFLTELVAPDRLTEAVSSYVDAILECEPGVIRSMKKSLNEAADGAVDVAGQRAAYEQSLQSEELRRRLEARLR